MPHIRPNNSFPGFRLLFGNQLADRVESGSPISFIGKRCTHALFVRSHNIEKDSIGFDIVLSLVPCRVGGRDALRMWTSSDLYFSPFMAHFQGKPWHFDSFFSDEWVTFHINLHRLCVLPNMLRISPSELWRSKTDVEGFEGSTEIDNWLCDFPQQQHSAFPAD